MSTKYIYTFGLIMTVVVALVLAGFKTLTADVAARNEDIFNKRQILAAIATPMAEAGQDVDALSDEAVLELFDNQVEQTVINAEGEIIEGTMAIEVDMEQEKKKDEADRLYPLYTVNLDGSNYYIMSVRGNGLWDAIWGNIALEDDLNTVAGVSFDHAGETPGLGAEIKDNQSWKNQFEGRKIYDDAGDFVSIVVRKGGARNPEHEVDGLSGATVTADGVTKMLYTGLKAYEPFLQDIDKASGMNLK
ncbi:NADH:ubiquinone reductase (Na(+)-transporting) subunit C [Lewinella sp. W8]|uniref:NADH:ubiquinone reductase (Na(+)-transporting) subunit C n=1 Tax=Lewinella sp. W8 TaxID=2528208 RepID=UPI0010675CEC|nr:NADH:ubiquinone reductase (Na(+)-transporting) subunit C [Lewinella sp. W8]MTB50573.1 NADH:ubiquinone reductase (Na(+)-transporting) subunit C [Lewinella sp. W8]